MAARKANEYTLVELKDLLRERSLLSSGNKAELINRLTDYDPNIWDVLAENERRIEQREREEAERMQEELWRTDRNRIQDGLGPLAEGGAENTPNNSTRVPETRERGDRRLTADNMNNQTLSEEANQADLQREREWLRRERELLDRERELLRREQQFVNRMSPNIPESMTSGNSVPNDRGIRAIKDLLMEFDGSNGDFQSWKQQLELLMESYQLDDKSMRILIGSRIKGRALNWFHSKAEHLTLGIDDLLREMQQMFDLRPGRLTMRKNFEGRMWRVDESFADYYHEKVILANKVPIEEAEIVDYLIEGIPERRLQDQARLMSFSSKMNLLKAFENISLSQPRKPSDFRGRRDVKSSSTMSEGDMGLDRRLVKCFRCRETGHIASRCPSAPTGATSGMCFRCHAPGHIARDCSQPLPGHPKEGINPLMTSANIVQPSQLKPAYLVPVSFSADDENTDLCMYSFNAMVDSGSPISLIKSSCVPDALRSPVPENVERFSGINDSPIKIVGVINSPCVRVHNIDLDLVFFIVTDDTMHSIALLGRDFTKHPKIKINLEGDSIQISERIATGTKNNLDMEISQIMQINFISEPKNVLDELQINSEVGAGVVKKIHESYEHSYLKNFNSGKTESNFEMSIELKHKQPVSFRPRRLSFSEKGTLQKILDDLSDRGFIRPSNSPYASPIVMAKKKNGETRLCVDYRELNKITIRDNFPTQRIDDNLDQLKNKKYYTTLDLKDGFHHVKMSESSVQYTSFITPLGQFEYLVMPYGLMNGPRKFQRYVNAIFEPLIRKNKILLYLDDILIATNDLDEHLTILGEVFELAGKNHLQFRLDKCHFAETEIIYLGYQVSERGIRPSKNNIEAVLNYPAPRNAKQLQRFIGLASYFRRFISGFSVIAEPLYNLLKKDAKYEFGSEECEAFETLKGLLSTRPLLAIYSPEASTELHCDASASGFGAILLQKQGDGAWRPVMFFSQRTTPTESRYHSFELECLAVVYAIKRFRIYLAGIKFRVVTDCDSFRLTLGKQSVNPRISRWALFLEDFDYEIVHRPGKRMSHVDALSRCESIHIIEANTFDRTLSICQDKDEEIRKIRDNLEENESKFFELRDGLVYRKDQNKKLLFYVPTSMEGNVIRTCHDDLGHVGVDKVAQNISKVYWFPHMREKIRQYISNCLRCIEFSPASGKREGFLHNIPKGDVPFHTLHIDHCGPLEKTGKGYKHVLVIVDGFTKFVKIYPCKSTTSQEAEKWVREYFRNYSKPKRIISDRGTAFTSDAFKEFLSSEMIDHVLIAVGTPRANGQVERFNRDVTPMIAKLCDDPNKWDRVLDQVEFAINNTINRSTGETPSQLLFGVDQKGKVNDNVRDFLEERTNSERNLRQMREKAAASIKRNQELNKKCYDGKHKPANVYNVGDYVMITNRDTSQGVNKKLLPKKKGPYVVRKVLDHDRYVVSDIDGFQVTQKHYTGVLAPDQMTPYINEEN